MERGAVNMTNCWEALIVFDWDPSFLFVCLSCLSVSLLLVF